MLDLDGIATGILVTSFDGRPIKVEGHPGHPSSVGGTTVFAQASICGLYDPDRSRGVLRRRDSAWSTSSWDEFAAFAGALRERLRGAGGKGITLLLPRDSSPTRARLVARLGSLLPGTRVVEYGSWSRDPETLGAQLAFGQSCRALWAPDRARVILCLDADPCGPWGPPVYARALAEARDPERGEPALLYVAESSWSLTGSLADRRLPLRSSLIPGLSMALDAALSRRLDPHATLGPPQRHPELPALHGDRVSGFLTELVEELLGSIGQSLVLVGRHQPPLVHALGHRLNVLLGNSGHTIRYLQEPGPDPRSELAGIGELARELSAGRVGTLVVLGANPAYDAPTDLRFEQALRRAGLLVHAGLYQDETSTLATWHLPLAHPLEAWGDGRAHDGTLSLAQPVIEPLHGGRSTLEILALLTGDQPSSGRELVRQTHGERWREERHWRRAVHDGYLPGADLSELEPTLRPLPALALEAFSDLELTFGADYRLYDGRYANLAPLQELPDPVSQLAWGNAALIAPETAARLGVDNGEQVTLEVGGRRLALPLLVIPGQATDSVRVNLGHGRRRAGRVGGLVETGVPPVGADAGTLRSTAGFFVAQTLTLVRTGRMGELATLDQFGGAEPSGLAAIVPELVQEREWRPVVHSAAPAQHGLPAAASGPRWGMAVDLHRCIGCQACVVACRIENNIPVVGQSEVKRGRDLAWLRVDRYFAGPTATQLVWQPRMCQACEAAPCEQVCPVGATLHTPEGLNDMVYNRCLGARFCANNCPYKVRRFNYLDYAARATTGDFELVRLGINPEVSVRSRGVMEKCSFCIQRIQRAKLAARSARRPITDGEIQTACAQACPTGALVFGDLAHPDSAVSRLHALPRAYALLAELNTRPRVRYLARIGHRCRPRP